MDDSYDTWKGWGAPFSYTRDEAGYFIRELADLRIHNADVLEIGFGAGNCLAWMRDSGARVAGSELSERACAAARRIGIELLPLNLPKHAQDHAGRFDSIIALDVFEHLDLPQVSSHLRACETMLRPGGRLLLRFPNAQSPFGLQPQVGDPTHRTPLSRETIRYLIAGLNLEIIAYRGSTVYFGHPLSPRGVKRRVRRGMQVLIGIAMRFIFASDIPYDPVVVLVLQLRTRGVNPLGA